MKIFNSMTNSLEEFTSDDGQVGVYVCGVTPYDTTHLGHAFTFLTYDVLVRYLRHLGFSVTYVQNVTDIDDDIIRKSRELGIAWDELGRRETNQYLDDMRNLNAVPFDHYVAATEHVGLVVENVRALVEAGVAYESNGSVYFSVEMDPDFGKLSKIPRPEMLPIANERGNFPDDPNKKDPLDFVLWQAAQPGEPTWPSPWGAGRPGWHIECSSMARQYLGDTFDIHGGGIDLIFPHHEATIAQAESATGQEPFVRYWMHAGMVEYQGTKMSKSLGNLVYVRDLLEKWSADAIRLCLVDHHYREDWEFFDDQMNGYQKAADLLKRAAGGIHGGTQPFPVGSYRTQFLAAMDNDLDTSTAAKVLLTMADEMRKVDDVDTREASELLKEYAGLLGLTLQ